MDSKKREQIEKAVVELGGVFPLMDKDYLYQRFDGRYFADKYWSPTVICNRGDFEQVKADLANDWHKRDELIERLYDLLDKKGWPASREALGDIIDSGWRPTEQQQGE
jgi:hypothetical protein